MNAKFYRDDAGRLMFYCEVDHHVIDRPADDTDQVNHPGAWAAWQASEGSDTPPADAPPPATEAPRLEKVTGIGPATADELRAAGVDDVRSLAALTDADVAGLDVKATTRQKVIGEWRDAARRLLEGRA